MKSVRKWADGKMPKTFRFRFCFFGSVVHVGAAFAFVSTFWNNVYYEL